MAINGTLAGDTNNYPQIDVQYKWKICNYDDSYSVNLLNDPKTSYFKVWNAKTKNFFNEFYDSSTTLEPYESGSGSGSGPGSDGNCISRTINSTIDTAIPDWFVSAKFEGHPPFDGVRPESLPYCYAYAFNPIKLSYGPCTMSVSTK
jgi:hypothetical protein